MERESTHSNLFWVPEEDWIKAIKKKDTVVTVFLVDPLIRIVLPSFLRLKATPNQVTVLSFATSLLNAWLFYAGHTVVAGVVFFLWYAIDCIDGKIARLTNRCTSFGQWLDLFTDRLGTSLVVFGLAGYYLRAGDMATAVLAFAFLTTWFLGIMNQTVLRTIAPKFENVAEIRQAEPEASSNHKKGFLKRYVAFVARWRLAPWPVADVEWLMTGLVLGPVTGYVFPCLLAALVGFVAQRGLRTLGFWWRRRAQIATAG